MQPARKRDNWKRRMHGERERERERERETHTDTDTDRGKCAVPCEPTLMFGFFSLRNMPVPASVPAVPVAHVNASTFPSDNHAQKRHKHSV